MEKFNALLNETELEYLKLLLNQHICLQFERASYYINGMDSRIDGQGKVGFVTTSNRDYYSVEITVKPTMFFLPIPAVEQGGVSIDCYTVPNIPLAERLKIIHPPQTITSTFDHINFLPVSKIQFYGNSQKGYINELDSDVTLENMIENYGINKFPYVELDSIEFIVIIHEYRYVTILRVEEHGFCVWFKDYEAFIMDPHSHFNSYQKNIVLQHQIG